MHISPRCTLRATKSSFIGKEWSHGNLSTTDWVAPVRNGSKHCLFHLIDQKFMTKIINSATTAYYQDWKQSPILRCPPMRRPVKSPSWRFMPVGTAKTIMRKPFHNSGSLPELNARELFNVEVARVYTTLVKTLSDNMILRLQEAERILISWFLSRRVER